MHSSYITVMTSKKLEAAGLALLSRGYGVSLWDDLKWHDIRTKFHDDRLEHADIKVIFSTILEATMLVLLIGGVYEVCYWDGSGGLMLISAFMKIDSVFNNC
jgi:hypothetical protein